MRVSPNNQIYVSDVLLLQGNKRPPHPHGGRIEVTKSTVVLGRMWSKCGRLKIDDEINRPDVI